MGACSGKIMIPNTLHVIFYHFILFVWGHRLRPIDTHLELYTMLYNNSAKNRYAEPVKKNNEKIKNHISN